MCGVLTEMLSEHGYGDIIEMLKELAKNGQIEFTGSGKYHPILPLIPKGEVERQIMENAGTNRHFWAVLFLKASFRLSYAIAMILLSLFSKLDISGFSSVVLLAPLIGPWIWFMKLNLREEGWQFSFVMIF